MSDDVARDGIRPQERTDAPEQKPAGELGGQPINADETAPREEVPNPDDDGSANTRHSEAVDDEPGSDL